MNRLRFPLLAAVYLMVPASAVWSAPVPAAHTGLEQVPDTAPVVVHLRGVQGTRDRLVAMMKNALPDVLKKFQGEMDDFLQNGKDGRKIRGLRPDGPIFLVVTELPKSGQGFSGPPPIAVIAAVTDYKEFRDGILNDEERKGITDKGDGIQAATLERDTTYFLERKGYAVVTPSEEIAKSFTKKFTGLHTKMSKEQAAKLLTADLGAYVNMESVNKEYADDIKKAKEGIQQGIDFASGAGDDSQKKIMEVFRKAIDPIFQAIEDMHAIVVTVEMKPGGLAFHMESELKENSTTANLLQDSRPIAFDELKRLPRDRAFYFGMKASAAMFKNLGGLMANIQPEGAKDTGALMTELANAGPDVLLIGGSFPFAALTVYRYDDPAKAVATTLKTYRNMDPKANNLKSKPEVKENVEKHGEFKLHSVQLTLDLDKIGDQAGAKGGDVAKNAAIAAVKGFWGEKSTMWFGTDGKTVVQINAPDWSTAEKLLDQYTKGAGAAGEAKAFGDVRKEMPARTSLLGLVDAVNMFGTIFEALKPIIPAGQLPPGWPNLPAKPTSAYVGMAVTFQPNRGSFDLFISAAAAQEFYKAIVKPLVGE